MKKLLAVMLAAFMYLTLAAIPAGATHPEPTPPPPPEDQVEPDCWTHAEVTIPTRRGRDPLRMFVTVTASEGITPNPTFIVEKQYQREFGRAHALDGGTLDGSYEGRFHVRRWRDVEGLVRIRVNSCDDSIVVAAFAS